MSSDDDLRRIITQGNLGLPPSIVKPETVPLAYGVCRILVGGQLRGMGTHVRDGWIVTSGALFAGMHSLLVHCLVLGHFFSVCPCHSRFFSNSFATAHTEHREIDSATFTFDAELRGSQFRPMPGRRVYGWSQSVPEYCAVVSVLAIKLGLQRVACADLVPRYSEDELMEQQLIKHLRCYSDPDAGLLVCRFVCRLGQRKAHA
jgi:hypothetical protein